MRYLFTGGAVLLGALLPAAAAGRAATTTVRPGEDCQAIVRRVYGGAPGAMARFHSSNPQLGGLPHVLRAGDSVNTPPLGRRPDGGRGAEAPRQGRAAEVRQAEAAPQQGGTLSRAAEQLRLVRVGPGVRTRAPGDRGGWSEALPEQQLPRRGQVQTAEAGVELRLEGRQGDLVLQLGPRGELQLEALPLGRRPGAVVLRAGALYAQVPRGAQLLVRTAAGQLRLRGSARVEAEGPVARVAIYEGGAEAEAEAPKGRRPRELTLRPGDGAHLRAGERPAAVALPATPGWEGQGPRPAPLLQVAQGPLDGALPGARLALPFVPIAGAGRYLVEVARDDRFSERRGGGTAVAAPYLTTLPPGTYYARVSAVSREGLIGPAAAARRVEIIPLRSDAARRVPEGGVEEPAGTALEAKESATVTVPATGRPVQLSLDGGPDRDCAGGCSLRVGPGEHRLLLRVGDARAEVPLSVAPTAAPPAVAVEPAELPVPLAVPGFPSRALHPRTRVYGLFSFGAARPGRSADTVRLDLGGEYAFFSRRFSVDLNLPVLYHAGPSSAGLSAGDLGVGFRAVALQAAGGRLSVGPLLRLQLPTGTFERPLDPGSRPVVLDPALGGAAQVGPVGLLTTQGPTVVLNVPVARLRWSMSYAAEVRFWRMSVAAALDAAIGMTSGAGSGVSLGGGARFFLGRFRVLGYARGGLGEGGEALFGRYQAGAGLEWVR